MPAFGGYETVRELFRSGLASAYTARKAGGDGPDRFVVKTYQPFVPGGEGASQPGLLEGFLDGARVQQKVAATGASHWAAIHEVGQAEGGAYYVTDNHHRSVQHLIRGRVKLTGGGLYQIVSAVVQGLIELKQAAGRPHGNLKPSNVLLSGKSDIARARVLLTDPAGSGDLDPGEGAGSDYRAVGEMIYRLVLHRTGRAMGALRAVEGKEWDRLGKNGEPWRLLCNRLLSPNLDPVLTTLEDLAADVEKLRERAGASPARLLIPVAVVILGIVAVLVGPSLYKRMTGTDPNTDGGFGETERQRWVRLCHSWKWLRPLLVECGKHGGRMPAWERDEHLRTVALPRLAKINANSSALNPRWFAKMTRFTHAEQCAEKPSKAAQAPEGIRQTKLALEAIDALRDSLSSPAWPACAKLKDAAQAVRKRTWAEPVAAYFEQLIAFDPNDVPDRTAAILGAQTALHALEGEWAKVEALRGKLVGWGESGAKPLAGIGRYIEAEVGAIEGVSGENPPARLLVRLKDLHAPGSLLRRLETLIAERSLPAAKKLDWPYIESNPPFADMTEEDLHTGLQALEDGKYDVLDDPFRDPTWATATAEFFRRDMPEQLRGLREMIDTQKSGDLLPAITDANARADFEKRLADAGATVSDLQKRLEALKAFADQAAAKPCTRATIVQKNADKTAISQRQEKLTDEAEATRGDLARTQADIAKFLQNTWDGYVAALRSRKEISRPTGRKSLAPIDAAWIRQRDNLITAAAPKRQVAELSRSIAALEGFLQRLEAKFDPNLPEPVRALAEQEGQWHEKLLDGGLDRQRSQRVQGTLSYVDWAKVSAGQAEADAQFQSAKATHLAAYEQWRSGLARLVPDFDQVRILLADGYGLKEKPSPDANSIGELIGRNAANVVWTDADANQGFQATHARVVRLRQVGRETSAQALLDEIGRARSDRFESSRAAYLRLTQTGWPASRDDLSREPKERDRVASAYRSSRLAAPRKAALLKELTDTSRSRWIAFAQRAAEADDINKALSLAVMKDFGIDPKGASLPQLIRYRLAMGDLLREVQAQPGRLADARVKSAVSVFLAKAAPLSAIRQDASFSGVYTELAKVPAAAGGGGVDLTKAGPGSVSGWSIGSRTADQVTYSSGSARLVFRKVTPPGGTPCFLCTTEVSLGLFRQLAGTKWQDFDRLLPLDEDAVGPRGWSRSDQDLTAAESWMHDAPPTLMGRVYPAGSEPQAPKDAHPMQHVPFPAALYVCRLLNCRLPTSAEWLEAGKQNVASGSSPPNLRDATWKAQRDHLARLVATDQVLATLHWPDVGTFVPKGMTLPAGKAAEPVAGAANDGMLWFATVDSDSGRAFSHLTGNVAEYTYEQPDALTRLASGTQTALAEVTGLAKPAGRAPLRVIGGSALSAAKVAPNTPQPVPDPATGEEWTQSFSDVGFRLAFTAGRERLQDQVLGLLGTLPNQGYLSPTP